VIRKNVTIEVSQMNKIILADNTDFSFKPLDGYGLAVDVGTTSLVAQLIDLEKGKVYDAATAINHQSRYGADIMSRISYGLKPDGLSELCRLIRNQVGNMIQDIMERNKVSLQRIVLVGNTVMHHLFSGLPVDSLAFYPFISGEGTKRKFTASQLKWKISPGTDISFMPSIGSFVGSDMLAGILATGMNKAAGLTAFIDLGTNGEIAVGNREQILVASTAAGPAFEGINISHGMQAASGAISSVTCSDGKPDFHVIGNEPPRGICGSGLIDAISVFLETGQIDQTGQITSGDHFLLVSKPVILTQKDIHEFILAKAAIASGLHILVNRLGKSYDDIEKVFIAGAFGNFINLDNAISLGLLEFSREKIIKAGNTALIGAKMMLFIEDGSENQIINVSRHVSLEAHAEFQDVFIDKMMLGSK
jgi:uncharacterized 2Fe-2S/4Fe-4S cluster protein (DUF4445 family)